MGMFPGLYQMVEHVLLFRWWSRWGRGLLVGRLPPPPIPDHHEGQEDDSSDDSDEQDEEGSNRRNGGAAGVPLRPRRSACAGQVAVGKRIEEGRKNDNPHEHQEKDQSDNEWVLRSLLA